MGTKLSGRRGVQSTLPDYLEKCKMPKRGKKYRALAAKLEPGKRYEVKEAAKLLRESSSSKFDATIDIAVRLGVNPRHADQMVRGAIVLPHGTGKSVRVAVFAKGDKVKEAEDQ